MLDRFAPDGDRSRAITTINQMRRAGVFPSIDAPTFSVNGQPQHGGDLSKNDMITISAEAGVVYYGIDGVDPRLPGGDLNPAAAPYTDPIAIDHSTVIKARLLQDGEWSSVSEARFRINTVAADPTNLRISEINFHPSGVTAAEAEAGVGDADDFEFIELVNLSDATLDLNDVRFRKVDVDGDTQGIDFEFGAGAITELGPGERILVVENIDAFHIRYGQVANIAGEWSGALSNAGEAISLSAGDELIHEFSYADDWYPATDGEGSTLQIVDETADPSSWSLKESWRASSQRNGTPGSPDTNQPIAGDSNRDGIFNSKDLVQIFQIGEFEDDIDGNSIWEDGDWNGDGDFTTADLVYAFQQGTYQANAIAAVSSLFSDIDEAKRKRRLADDISGMDNE